MKRYRLTVSPPEVTLHTAIIRHISGAAVTSSKPSKSVSSRPKVNLTEQEIINKLEELRAKKRKIFSIVANSSSNVTSPMSGVSSFSEIGTPILSTDDNNINNKK